MDGSSNDDEDEEEGENGYKRRMEGGETSGHRERERERERESFVYHEAEKERSGAASWSFETRDRCELLLVPEAEAEAEEEDDGPVLEETPITSSTSSTVSASRRPIVSGMKDEVTHARPPSDPKTIKGK